MSLPLASALPSKMKLIPWLLCLLTTCVSACLLHSERHNLTVTKRFAVENRSDMPIGTGDRFDGGKIAPVGLGVRNHKMESILNPQEIISGLRALANEFPAAQLFTAPHKTHEQASLEGISVGDNPRVFVMSGVHARERGGPDYVLYFLADLLQANRTRCGLQYGQKMYSYEQVQQVLSAGIVVLPLVNPDGVAYDQKTDYCWRKNRNMASSAGDPDGFDVGVDLNRNFDFLWDYRRHFAPGADWQAVGSKNPMSEVFHGTEPMSEPETKNVAWVFDSFPSVSWFADLHSFGGDILYGWGDDNFQIQDANQNFANEQYDKKRGFVGIDPIHSQYREFFQTSDLASQLIAAKRMQTAMKLAGRLLYNIKESVNMYPTSGAATDYAMSRWYKRRCGPGKVLSFTIEFGKETSYTPCPFYPSPYQYHQWMREANAGFMELMLRAAEEAPAPVVQC